MADDAIKVTDPGNVPVTFVNQVLGQGFLNGVLNVTMGVARFTPNDKGVIDVDMIVASRLRMDLTCAVQLRDSLDDIIKKHIPAAGETIN